MLTSLALSDASARNHGFPRRSQRSHLDQYCKRYSLLAGDEKITPAEHVSLQLSAGNSYVFGTSRSLYSLALAGQAPAVLKKLNRNGVPYVCVLITMAISCLSYLSVSAGVSTSRSYEVEELAANS